MTSCFWQGKSVLITGASSGIGEALAYALAKSGVRSLFLCGRNASRLSSVASECRHQGCLHVSFQILDVTDSPAVSRWLFACDAVEPLDVVFANAGVSTGCETAENVRNTFATNVAGVVNTVLSAIDCFRSRKRGQIVITSSIAGNLPLAACPSYAATKACVKSWGLSLRGHLKAEGIRVNVICPGFVRSRITDENTCPMPFFWEAEKAARVILARVARNVPLIAFPWQMCLGSWLLSCLPARVLCFLTRQLPKKTRT